jgi:hypothetical protein
MKNVFKKILPLLAIAIIIYIIIMSVSVLKNAQSNTKNGEKRIRSSNYSDTISNGSILLINNIWGATDKEKSNKTTLKSYVYLESDGDFGWEWSRPDPRPDTNTYIPPIYPEVMIGAPHGSLDSTTFAFPIKYGDIDTWTNEVDFNYTKKPEGEYDFAYDIYFVDKSNPDINKFNVMIWISGHLTNDKSIKVVSDGINEYDYYYRDPNEDTNWPWSAFVLKNQGSSNFKVNIKKLLEQVPPDMIDDNWYVQGIELGHEIYRGSGKIEISKYVTNLNGHIIQKGSNVTRGA